MATPTNSQGMIAEEYVAFDSESEGDENHAAGGEEDDAPGLSFGNVEGVELASNAAFEVERTQSPEAPQAVDDEASNFAFEVERTQSPEAPRVDVEGADPASNVAFEVERTQSPEAPQAVNVEASNAAFEFERTQSPEAPLVNAGEGGGIYAREDGGRGTRVEGAESSDNPGASLAPMAAAQAEPSSLHPGLVVQRDPHVELQNRLAKGVPANIPNDSRITLLFDLNGVLFIDKKEKRMRNGIEALKKLSKQHFRLGIYSSRTAANIDPAMRTLEKAVGPRLFARGVVLSRDQCSPASETHLTSENAKPWDVIKPLQPSFPGDRMARVILLDDDSFKAVPGEERNMIVLPSCKNNFANKDTVLSDLVEMLTNIQDVNDVRDFTAEISETIAYGRKQSATLEEAHQEDTVAEPDLMEAARDNDDAAKAPSSDFPWYAVLNGQEGSGIFRKLKQARHYGRHNEYAPGTKHSRPCFKPCDTYSAAKEFLNTNLGISIEYMAVSELKCFHQGKKFPFASREGDGWNGKCPRKTQFFSVIRNAQEKAVVVRTRFPLTSGDFSGVVAFFSTGDYKHDEALKKAVELSKGLNRGEAHVQPQSEPPQDALGLEALLPRSLRIPEQLATQEAPSPEQEGTPQKAVYKIPFYAVLNGKKGSGVYTKSKDAKRHCKNGPYKCSASDRVEDSCYLECKTYEAARAFLNEQLGLNMDWMARLHLRSLCSNPKAMTDGFAEINGIKGCKHNNLDCYSVVRNKDNHPVVVRTKFPLTRAMVPGLLECFKMGDGGAYKNAVKLAAETAKISTRKRQRDEVFGSEQLQQGHQDLSNVGQEQPKERESKLQKAAQDSSVLPSDANTQGREGVPAALAQAIRTAVQSVSEQSKHAGNRGSDSVTITDAGMEVIDLTGDDDAQERIDLTADSGRGEEADAFPSDHSDAEPAPEPTADDSLQAESTEAAKIVAGLRDANEANPKDVENNASAPKEKSESRNGENHGVSGEENRDINGPTSTGDGGSDSEPLVSGLEDNDNGNDEGDDGYDEDEEDDDDDDEDDANGDADYGPAEDAEDDEENVYLGEFHSASDAKKPAAAASVSSGAVMQTRSNDVSLDTGGSTVAPTSTETEVKHNQVADCSTAPSDPEHLRQPVVDLSSIPATERNMWFLHNQVAELANEMVPSEADQEAVYRVLSRVRAAVLKAFGPGARAVLFGSRATGLSLNGGDVDIVILGVKGVKMPYPSQGLTGKSKKKANKSLGQLLNLLLTSKDLVTHKFIKTAKVPIIKGTMREGGRNFDVDICIGASSGEAAIKLVMDKVSAEPALRPLVICVKAFLRQKGLSELYSGGLSSYAVFNLVLAHLQAEGATSKDDSRWRLPSASPGGEQSDKRTCLGFLLWSFFHRFGFTFDYREQAISIQKQGITEKQLRWRKPSSPWLLAIEDPQELGCDIGTGAFNIRMVRAAFAAAADVLESSDNMGPATSEDAEQRQARLWAAVQADGASSSNAPASQGPGWVAQADTLIRADPLGGIMDWRAEFSATDDRRKESSEAGKAQVASTAEAVGLATVKSSYRSKAKPVLEISYACARRKNNPNASEAEAAKKPTKAEKKLAKARRRQAKAKAAESIESRVARINSASPGPKRGRHPGSGAAEPDCQRGSSGGEGKKRRVGKKARRNNADQSPGRQTKRGRWNAGP